MFFRVFAPNDDDDDDDNVDKYLRATGPKQNPIVNTMPSRKDCTAINKYSFGHCNTLRHGPL